MDSVVDYNQELQIDTYAQNGMQGGSAIAVRPLLLTCQLLTDRMLLYSSWLTALASQGDPITWVTDLDDPVKQNAWAEAPGIVESFPEVSPYRERYNLVRRFNEFTWDYHLRPPSRLSIRKHVREKKRAAAVKMLYGPARLAAAIGLARPIERSLEMLLLGFERSSQARKKLIDLKPDVVITTDPFSYLEPAIVAEAKRLGIKTLAVVTSWDNLSTKNRMVFQYDGYILWSEQMRKDLHRFYPYTRDVPSYVVGAPQFDVFFQERFQQSRERFCLDQGLRPDKPIIVYTLGSPNFLRELPGAVEFARRLAQRNPKDAQLLVRPHPMFFNGKELEAFHDLPENIQVQTSGGGRRLTSQVQSGPDIVNWVNTFRHADVLVNLSSTTAIDAAIFDRPVINLDFDPEAGQPNQMLIDDINHRWTHFKPIAESGGMWLVKNYDEMMDAVEAYLENPELHKEKRRWMAEYVCGDLDGNAGERMAEAIFDFVKSNQRLDV